MKNLFYTLLFLISINTAFAKTHDNSTDTVTLKKVKIMLGWDIQPQFAGPIMAKEKGFFIDEGLDVEIISSSSTIDPVVKLKNGDVDYAIFWLMIAMENNMLNDTKVILINQFVQHSNYAIVAWKEDLNDSRRKISSLKDLDLKKISLFTPKCCLPFYMLFKNQKITPQITHHYNMPSTFITREVQAASVSMYNELKRCFLRGVHPDDVVIFMLKDYGINLPEDGLYTLKEKYNKEESSKISRAIRKGWEYANENPVETAKIILEQRLKENIPTNQVLVTYMLKTILPSILLKTSAYGKLSKESFNECQKLLETNLKTPLMESYESFAAEGARL